VGQKGAREVFLMEVVHDSLCYLSPLLCFILSLGFGLRLGLIQDLDLLPFGALVLVTLLFGTATRSGGLYLATSSSLSSFVHRGECRRSLS
jgi:hypothetical protein